MSFITTKLHNARKSLRADANRYKVLDAKLKSLAPEIKAVYEMFPPAHRRNLQMFGDVWNDTLRLSLSLHDLDSFKDRKLTRLLEKFADWEASTSDFTYGNPNRDYYFTLQHPRGLTFKVAIYAYVKSDSPNCRIVVRGVTQRVVEEEIREIVCV
jgi:hypothetical protein